jgi:hypothetical protein
MVEIQTGCGVCASTGATARVATTTQARRIMSAEHVSHLPAAPTNVAPSPSCWPLFGVDSKTHTFLLLQN